MIFMKFGMIWTYSNKVMQGNLDADDDDTDNTADDESNPYMSPFQATQYSYILSLQYLLLYYFPAHVCSLCFLIKI